MRSKILLVALAFCLVAMGAPPARAQDEVNFDYFYTALQDQGDWFATDSFGYVFQPRSAAKDPNWRPYSDGYWSFTDEGWTWMSYEDFGWATYHYGRWAKLASIGWVWVPGYEWAPAWVSWRTNPSYDEEASDVADQPVDPESDYIGWAPLPPSTVMYPGAILAGGIDEVYDIPPENYCFVPTPLFCAPALVVVIVVPARNYFCIGRTINVTHCRYRDHHGIPRIYCGGPNIGRLQGRVPRPIPRFTIVRRNDAPLPTRDAPALLNEVRGHNFHVIAPRIAPPAGVAPGAVGVPRNATTARPPRLKAEIARAQLVPGWNTPGVQPQAVQAARAQFKREAAQSTRQAIADPATAPITVPHPVPTSLPASGGASAPTNPPPRPRRVVETPGVPPSTPRDTARTPNVSDAPRAAVAPSPEAAELARRQQIIAEQRRRANAQSAPQDDSQEAQRQQQIEAQQRSQSEAQARMQAMREQQAEQARQAQANAQAQRQQQLEAQRQAQADRQRQAQAEAQARAAAQRDATRQQQQQAEQQRRAAEAQRRMDAARGAQGTPVP